MSQDLRRKTACSDKEKNLDMQEYYSPSESASERCDSEEDGHSGDGMETPKIKLEESEQQKELRGAERDVDMWDVEEDDEEEEHAEEDTDQVGVKEKRQNGQRMKLKTPQDMLPYICGICEKSFPRKCELMSHMMKHTGERPYACKVCSRAFGHRSSLREHQNLHTGFRPFKCNQCNKSFARAILLKVHCERHHSHNDLKCGNCNETFNTNPDSRTRVRSQENQRSYPCSDCGVIFTTKSDFDTHLSRCNVTNVRIDKPECDDRLKRYLARKCEICNARGFAYRSSLATHMKRVHGVILKTRQVGANGRTGGAEQETMQYVCNVCHKEYKTKQTLQSHQMVHSNERPFACDKCEKAYKDKSTLRKHKLDLHNEMCIPASKIAHFQVFKYL